MSDRIQSVDKICPRCGNNLAYWISDDYYSKGKKYYECEVCDWKPSMVQNKECSCKQVSGDNPVCSIH
jgi:formate dehydrogenase maturation protein FdhE